MTQASTLSQDSATDTMLAAIFKGEGEVALERRPIPHPESPDDIVIKVGAVGICGSDLHALHTPPTHPGKPGVIFGHEFCGEIVEMGSAVSGLSIGQHVAVDQNPPCGRCMPCREGDGNFCETLFDNPYLDYPWPNTPGFFWDGGMANYVRVPAYFAYPVDPSVPYELIVLGEPLGCVLNALDKIGVRSNDRAVVIGGGPMGLLSAAALKHRGAQQVIVIEPSAARAAIALKLGADAVIDPKDGPVVDAVKAATGGRGASCIVEAVGSQLDSAIEMAADQARIAVLGINSANRASFPPMEVTVKELHIHGAFLMRYTMKAALDLIQSRALPLEHVVSHVLPLDEVLTGLQLAQRGEGLKIVFKP
ncbi:zinc-binding dehydrogenase [Mycobacterium sp. AT1]|uniref:zinc-dependent alcohol dehydrogenase n=1 Tax=Mycobacterium sp. AT1 TaxID=1961706 RepID=UPI0009AD11EE|nr:alcohol dehydrogenase catalytic domain-containing protein [Mycobacterium sp. AT1]OPX13269.1 hypothetical protein B1790_00960 [Mycobacterium sp. AT1]